MCEYGDILDQEAEETPYDARAKIQVNHAKACVGVAKSIYVTNKEKDIPFKFKQDQLLNQEIGATPQNASPASDQPFLALSTTVS